MRQVDEWLAFAPSLAAGPGLADAAAAVNEYLALRTFLVGYRLTLADVALWGQLTGERQRDNTQQQRRRHIMPRDGACVIFHHCNRCSICSRNTARQMHASQSKEVAGEAQHVMFS